jgi:transcriptional regulator with XRE-family HTH domain
VTVAIRCRTYQQLTEAIAARRRQLGLPQRDADDLCGLQPGYLGKIEKGIRKLGNVSLPMICAGLDIDILVAPRTAIAPIEPRTGSAGHVLHLDRQQENQP